MVRCDLGIINTTGSATVQIVATLLSPGTATNTVTVSAPQGDPNTANNSATTNTTVSGTAYNPVPVLQYLSPAGSPVGLSPLTFTAYGIGFSPASTLEWNGVALPTTYVSSSQLMAQVDAGKVASLGWAWVTVSSPGPGGGVSSPLPFTVFQTIPLTSNHILFDPFTRKIYASIPSTATQVTGNSVVAIDPYTGTLGTPLVVGGEPNKLAESDDGKYLYVSLDGTKSITRIDLTSMTQGGVYSATAPGSGTIPIRDIAVMPGSHDTLAVDTGYVTGIGVFDISGGTGSFRSTLTGPYTGSSLAFASASTVYSYDVDTSGETFNRWTVGVNGLTAVDQSTLLGMGGYSDAFKLANGLIYGGLGGVTNPATTPPTPMGVCKLANAVQSYQLVNGSGLVPYPAINRVFYGAGMNSGSSPVSPLLLTCDSSGFEIIGSIQLPGSSVMPADLVLWSNDGLAFRMSSSSPSTSSTILLMRGPLFLPQWYNTNPTPTVASTTPTNTAAGSGNLTITVTGSNFVPGALVLWKGAERTTTYVDASHLTAAIPASDLAVSGMASVTAVNPGSGTSASVTFTIN